MLYFLYMKKKKYAASYVDRYTTFIRSDKALSLIIGLLAFGILTGTFLFAIIRPPDNRAARINAYFSMHSTPLAGHGTAFVRAADKCDMDWRLLPAIAMQESTGGKFMKNNNPFGWGSAEIPFSNFDEAIAMVGKNICGDNPNTAQWYATTSTQEKLYYYNGTVAPSYPAEVMWIMEQI